MPLWRRLTEKHIKLTEDAFLLDQALGTLSHASLFDGFGIFPDGIYTSVELFTKDIEEDQEVKDETGQ